MVDDDRMRLLTGRDPRRCAWCASARSAATRLTAAVESDATSLSAIVGEMFVARTSERQGRLIDHDEVGAMEMKKREGYF